MTIDADFDKRLSRVVRRHERMKRNGVVHRVGRDGLIRSRPRLVRPAVPIRGIFLIVALFFAFKAVLFAQVGEANYDLRVEALRNGSMLEQAGAWMMQKEPVTQMLGGYLKPVFFDI